MERVQQSTAAETKLIYSPGLWGAKFAREGEDPRKNRWLGCNFKWIGHLKAMISD